MFDITWGTSLIMTLAVLLVLSPLLVHEAGHWALLTRYKVPVVEYWAGLGPVILRFGRLNIGMLPIGGAVVPEPVAYSKLSPKQQLLVALAGPFASFCFGVVLHLVAAYSTSSPSVTALHQLANLNFFLAAVNLLPIPPLDGFHAYLSYLRMRGVSLTSQRMEYFSRVGNGLIFGVGFWVVGWALFA